MPATTSAHVILQSAHMNAPMDLPEEFWRLVERYRSDLINQTLAILNNLEDAEDVVQETFCEAFRNPRRLEQVRSMGAWLRSINRANALNRLRQRRNEIARSEGSRQMAPPRTATTGGFSLLELREAVAKAIEVLPPDLREVVVLRYWEARSYAEIAERLDIPQGTVWKRISDASDLLYGSLNPLLHGQDSLPKALPGQAEDVSSVDTGPGGRP